MAAPAAACDRTILHPRGALRYRVTFVMRPTTAPSASTTSVAPLAGWAACRGAFED